MLTPINPKSIKNDLHYNNTTFQHTIKLSILMQHKNIQWLNVIQDHYYSPNPVQISHNDQSYSYKLEIQISPKKHTHYRVILNPYLNDYFGKTYQSPLHPVINGKIEPFWFYYHTRIDRLKHTVKLFLKVQGHQIKNGIQVKKQAIGMNTIQCLKQVRNAKLNLHNSNPLFEVLPAVFTINYTLLSLFQLKDLQKLLPDMYLIDKYSYLPQLIDQSIGNGLHYGKKHRYKVEGIGVQGQVYDRMQVYKRYIEQIGGQNKRVMERRLQLVIGFHNTHKLTGARQFVLQGVGGRKDVYMCEQQFELQWPKDTKCVCVLLQRFNDMLFEIGFCFLQEGVNESRLLRMGGMGLIGKNVGLRHEQQIKIYANLLLREQVMSVEQLQMIEERRKLQIQREQFELYKKISGDSSKRDNDISEQFREKFKEQFNIKIDKLKYSLQNKDQQIESLRSNLQKYKKLYQLQKVTQIRLVEQAFVNHVKNRQKKQIIRQVAKQKQPRIQKQAQKVQPIPIQYPNKQLQPPPYKVQHHYNLQKQKTQINKLLQKDISKYNHKTRIQIQFIQLNYACQNAPTHLIVNIYFLHLKKELILYLLPNGIITHNNVVQFEVEPSDRDQMKMLCQWQQWHKAYLQITDQKGFMYTGQVLLQNRKGKQLLIQPKLIHIYNQYQLLQSKQLNKHLVYSISSLYTNKLDQKVLVKQHRKISEVSAQNIPPIKKPEMTRQEQKIWKIKQKKIPEKQNINYEQFKAYRQTNKQQYIQKVLAGVIKQQKFISLFYNCTKTILFSLYNQSPHVQTYQYQSSSKHLSMVTNPIQWQHFCLEYKYPIPNNYNRPLILEPGQTMPLLFKFLRMSEGSRQQAQQVVNVRITRSGRMITGFSVMVQIKPHPLSQILFYPVGSKYSMQQVKLLLPNMHLIPTPDYKIQAPYIFYTNNPKLAEKCFELIEYEDKYKQRLKSCIKVNIKFYQRVYGKYSKLDKKTSQGKIYKKNTIQLDPMLQNIEDQQIYHQVLDNHVVQGWLVKKYVPQ